jgi:hypothetical protein
MALIPSESASFPDLLGRGLGASKKSKWRIPDEIALPAAEPVASKVEPVSQPEPVAEQVESKIEVLPQLELMAEPVESNAEVVPQLEPVESKIEVVPHLEPIAEPVESRIEPVPQLEPVAEYPFFTETSPAVPEPPLETTVEVSSAVELPASEPILPPAPLPEEKKVAAPTHAPIPIVRVARSIANRAPKSNPDLPASGPADQIEQTQATIAPAPAVPRLRTPLAKTRLRPRPSLQPRVGIGDDIFASTDFGQPAASEAPSSGVSVPIAPQYAALQSAPVAATGDAEEFRFPEADTTSPNLQSRRRTRLWRFILWELVALTIAVLAIMVGLSHRVADDPVAMAAKIVTIVFAIAVAVIPVVFYGRPEILPRSDR